METAGGRKWGWVRWQVGDRPKQAYHHHQQYTHTPPTPGYSSARPRHPGLGTQQWDSASLSQPTGKGGRLWPKCFKLWVHRVEVPICILFNDKECDLIYDDGNNKTSQKRKGLLTMRRLVCHPRSEESNGALEH